MQLYDMHSHILPKFDDGAKSADEALKLLDCLKKQGITNVCFTPHFYTNELSAEDFALKRDAALADFKDKIPEDMNIVIGAEVYVTRYLFSNEDFSKICYGDSNYILTEFGYSSRFSEHTMSYFIKLIENFGLTPVLPHVERYQTLMDDPEIIQELKDMGVIIQSNISNYTKKASLFRRRRLIKLINDDLIDIISSDAHSFTHNSPEGFTQALDCIRNKCGSAKLNEMMNTSKEIFDSAYKPL